MSVELTPEERDQLARRIDCPVSWCSGRWLDHGGDGEPPDKWFHADDEGLTLPYDLLLCRSQEGSGPGSVMLVSDKSELATAGSPEELVAILRGIANAIERIHFGR